VGPRSVSDGCEKIRPHRDSINGPSSSYTELRYLGSRPVLVFRIIPISNPGWCSGCPEFFVLSLDSLVDS
jgi:hypothetical protein